MSSEDTPKAAKAGRKSKKLVEGATTKIEVAELKTDAPKPKAKIRKARIEEAAEEVEISGETPENRPSAAKADLDSAEFMYGLKPVPFKERSFSAGPEVVAKIELPETVAEVPAAEVIEKKVKRAAVRKPAKKAAEEPAVVEAVAAEPEAEIVAEEIPAEVAKTAKSAPRKASKVAAKKKPSEEELDEQEPVAEIGPAPKLERLQKILAKAGISSRRKAEELILGGLVQINGQVVTELGTKADPARDHVRVDGKLLQGPERIRYFVLNKPKGFVTTVSDPEGRPTVMQFFERETERLYPVGRLDYLSEGLLLVTNDGELANKLTKAASGVEKTYLVKVSGQPTEEALEALRTGVVIEKGRPGTGSGRVRTAPAQIRQVREGDNPWYEVIIIEGRNRELRKMFEEIGHHVEKIRRVGYGPLVLDQEPGKLRELEPEEVEQLRLAADGKLKTRRRRGPAPAQLSRDAGKTVRFKKADGKPGYEKPNYAKPEAKMDFSPDVRFTGRSGQKPLGKPGFGGRARTPEPPVTEYVLPPRKPRANFEEDEKPAFNPDYKPGFRTGGQPGGRPGFGAGPRPGSGTRPGARSFGKPEGGRGGFGQRPDRGPGQDRPFRAAPPAEDMGPAEPRQPIHIEPAPERRDERPRSNRPDKFGGPGQGAKPFRPRTEGFAGGGKPFRAYPGGPATGDRQQRPAGSPFRPRPDGPGAGRPQFGRPQLGRPAAGGKPFRPRTDGPPSGERPFRPRAEGFGGEAGGRPAGPFRPAGESRPFNDRPGRPAGPVRAGGTFRPSAGDGPFRASSEGRPFRPSGDRPSFGRPSGPRPGGAGPGGGRPTGPGEFRPGPTNRPFRPAGPGRSEGRPDGPPRFTPRGGAPPTRRPKSFDGDAPREFRPRPAGRFDAPKPAPGGSNSKPSGKLGPDGQPRIKERHRDSFVGKNKGRPKPKGKKDE